MLITKTIFFVAWTIAVTGIITFIIRQLAFRKRKDTGMNISEGVHIAGLLIAALIIFLVIGDMSGSVYLRLEGTGGKMEWWSLLKILGSLATAGLLTLVFICYTARALGMVLFGTRKDSIEFRADNRPFAMVRAVILIVIALLLMPFIKEIYSLLLPDSKIPMYR